VADANKVRILARVIPDGIRNDAHGKPHSYRISLAMLPDLRPENNGIEIDIESWPRLTSQKQFQLYAATKPNGTIGAGVVEIKEWFVRGEPKGPGQTTTPQSYEFNLDRAKKAEQLWKRVFLADCGSHEQFGHLIKALAPPTEHITLNDGDNPRFVSYPVADLADGVVQFYSAHFAASTMAAAGQLSLDGDPGKTFEWDATKPIASPQLFQSLNAQLFGVYLPDTASNRMAVEARGIPQSTGTTHSQLVDYVQGVLESDALGSPVKAGYVSEDFVRGFREYLNKEVKENDVLLSYWNAFHTFARPSRADLQTAREKRESSDVYFGTMAAYLAPWTRGHLPGSADAPTPLLPNFALPKMTKALSDLREPITGYHAAWRPHTGEPTRLKGDKELEEIARKKFLSILARPGLAKFLGFIIDIEIRVSALESALTTLGVDLAHNAYFYLLADFGADDLGVKPKLGAIDNPNARVWTAAMIERVTTGGTTKSGFFGPCAKESFIAAWTIGLTAPNISTLKPIPYDRGVLNLAAPGNDKDPRFTIVDLDIDAVLHALENASQDRSTSLQKGAMEQNIPSALPDLRSRGLALIDRDRKSEMSNELLSNNTLTVGPQVLYAEDLVIGYRIDVGVCKSDDLALPSKERWLSLHNRTVQYDLNDIGKAYLSWVHADWAREDGFAKPITRELESRGSDGSKKTQYVAQETLAVWTGTSLAVQTLKKEKGDTDGETVTPIEPFYELGTNITFSLPTEAARRLPPLRFGRGYWMGARLVYANGASLPLEAVKDHYVAASTTAVGGKDKAGNLQGFVFKRGERASAPAILLPADDVLIKQPKTVHGETLSTAVVRGNARTRRYLVPRNTTFEIAEAHGEFDEQSPKSAFTRYARDHEHGAFPPAVEQEPDDPKRKNPGNVLKPGYSGNVPPYFPDPMARECLIRRVQHDADVNKCEEPKRVQFYRHKKMTIDQARPILVEVSAFEPKPTDPQYKIDVSEHHDMPRVHVHLAKAQDLDLILWTEPEDDHQLLTMRAVTDGWRYMQQALELYGVRSKDMMAPQNSPQVRALGELVELTAADKPFHLIKPGTVDILAKFRTILCAPSRTLSDQKRLRVIRPVKVPLGLEAPYVQPSAFRAVRLRIKPPDKPNGPSDPIQQAQGWPEYVTEQEKNNTPPLSFPSQEEGNTAFFVGTAKAHRPSTSKLRFQAIWDEYDDNDANIKVVREGQDARFEYHPVKDRAEFGFEFPRGAEPAKANELSELDLLRDETGQLRGLKIDFKNTKARQVKFSVRGVSRFTQFYRAPKTPNEALEFERHDGKKDFTYWIRSTKRPEKPEVDRILPLFSYTRTECRHGHRREITYQRNVALRVFLKRPWYSAGKDELLGVICWPANIFQGGSLANCTLLDSNVINPKEEFLTRWGADPIRMSGSLDDLIPAEAFSSAVKRTTAPLKLPLQPKDKDFPGGTPSFEIDKGCPNSGPLSPSDSVDVAIAGYKPVLDPQRGDLWYCDLPIDPQASYFPFIRLGLARYQEHSEADKELSYPVAEWAQIPPRRTVRVELLDNYDILVVVQGHGYHQTNTSEMPADQQEQLNHPVFRIRVCRSRAPDNIPSGDDDAVAWLPVIVAGTPLECRVTVDPMANSKATVDGIARPGPIMVCQKFRLPYSWRSHAYAVIVEEFEPMVADGAIYDEHVVVDRGPMFACTIPLSLRHHHPRPCSAAEGDLGERLRVLEALPEG
jgi:hypothetical protein